MDRSKFRTRYVSRNMESNLAASILLLVSWQVSAALVDRGSGPTDGVRL